MSNAINKGMEEAAEEYDVVASGVGGTVTLGDGQKVEIRKCRVKDTAAIIRFVSLLFDQLGINDISDGVDGAKDTLMERLNNPQFILQLIADSSERLYSVVVSLTSMDIDTFQELELDDAMAVIVKVVEVNYVFFTSKVMPMVASFAPVLSKAGSAKAQG